MVDKALEYVLTLEEVDITGLNELQYAAAVVISRRCVVGRKRKKDRKHVQKKAGWKVKIESEINTMRSDVEILQQTFKGNRVKSGKVKRVKTKYELSALDEIPATVETIKQKTLAKTQRVRRFEKRSYFFKHNKLFKDNPKKFYRDFRKNYRKNS